MATPSSEVADDGPKPKAGGGGRAGKPVSLLALGALGIVYGDIGTSPLYSLRETFQGHGHELEVVRHNVYGLLSLIVWSLLLVVTVKYLLVVTRADNDGEGGVLALTSLLRQPSDRSKPAPEGASDQRPPAGPRPLMGRRRGLFLLGLFGTALLYGDAAITPAISVLSAVEGTKIATPALANWVDPIAVAILVGLFCIQRRGTANIGKVFGPVMAVWFTVIGGLGVWHLAKDPGILAAVNPVYAVDFFVANRMTGFLALGGIVLVITGGEALYADMGHFGRRPIQVAWFALVLPALLLNYFGQGAMLLADPGAVDSPLFRMAPRMALYPMVVLATAATVIASQALISGVFSITSQAIQLGLAPRHRIFHTSADAQGQIYIPVINWALMAACIALVVGFRSSANLAAAYGVAVTSTMVITTVLFYVVARERFHWAKPVALAVCGLLVIPDLAYLGANLFKIPSGGWFPLAAAVVMFTLMTTWSTGRRIVAERIHRNDLALADYVRSLRASPEPPAKVAGTAIYLFSSPGLAPPALIANVRHNDVLHEQVVVLSIAFAAVPRVLPARRSTVTTLDPGVHQVVLHYGFMESPNVREGLLQGPAQRLGIDPDTASYFLGSETVAVKARGAMAPWREHLFAFLTRNAAPAAGYFGIPPERTMTIAMPVEV